MSKKKEEYETKNLPKSPILEDIIIMLLKAVSWFHLLCKKKRQGERRVSDGCLRR